MSSLWCLTSTGTDPVGTGTDDVFEATRLSAVHRADMNGSFILDVGVDGDLQVAMVGFWIPQNAFAGQCRNVARD